MQLHRLWIYMSAYLQSVFSVTQQEKQAVDLIETWTEEELTFRLKTEGVILCPTRTCASSTKSCSTWTQQPSAPPAWWVCSSRQGSCCWRRLCCTLWDTMNLLQSGRKDAKKSPLTPISGSTSLSMRIQTWLHLASEDKSENSFVYWACFLLSALQAIQVFGRLWCRSRHLWR